MAFQLSLPVLYETMEQYSAYSENILEELDRCHKSVMSLSESGWSGVSQAEFYENFFVWMQEGYEFCERVSYLVDALKVAALMAEDLKTQYNALPCTVGANAVTAGERIFLERSQTGAVQGGVSSLMEAWSQLVSTLARTRNQISELEYTALSVNLYAVQSNLNSNQDTLEEFLKKFSLYWDSVNEFEARSEKQFNYVSKNEFNYEDAQSLFGWDDAVAIGADLTAIGVKAHYRIPTITTSGDYTYFKGYKKADRYASRYLTQALESGKYPNASRVFKMDKGMKYFGTGVTILAAGYSAYQEYNRNPYLPMDRKIINASMEAGTTVGTTVLVGSVVGSIFPGVGTAVGFGLGVIVGTGIDWLLDRKFFDGGLKSIKNVASDFIHESWESTKNAWDNLKEDVDSTWNNLKEGVGGAWNDAWEFMTG